MCHLVAEACSALPGFQPTLTGGDGASVPLCEYLKYLYVAHELACVYS